MIPPGSAVVYSLAMAAVILFCRAVPFIVFRKKAEDTAGPSLKAFLAFVEKVVPPAAMTVLAFNAMAGPVRENPESGAPVLIAAAFTALLHFWKRNALVSIFGGTALYMLVIHF
jgi:branched-subunit amino acid transport protein AzlD